MTEIKMQKYSKDELLLRLATRLEADSRFMASTLYKYQQQEKLSRTDLIQRFELSPEQFAQLALCKRPDAESQDFAAQIRKISSVTKVDVSIIAAIIRQVDSLETLTRQPSSKETTVSNQQSSLNLGALAAARDREENQKTNDDDTNDEEASE
jgi:hypothetical protein